MAVHTDGRAGRKALVWVDSECEEAERIRILTHELAHIRCDHFDRDVTRAQGECEADSVAYVVCQVAGLDISASAVDYVATWASRDDPEVLEATLETIHNAAARRPGRPSLTPARPSGSTTTTVPTRTMRRRPP
jgi:hypothetical protein